MAENMNNDFKIFILVGAAAFIGMVRWRWDIALVVLSADFAGLIFKMFVSYSRYCGPARM